MKESNPELPVETADLLDLGAALGQSVTFGLVAGRCSAAQAAGLRHLREGKSYKRLTPHWKDFCVRFLKMSRPQVDHMIHLLEEFGPGYFELAQLTRISPETYRAIAPAVKDGTLQFQGESIELSAENSRKVAAAVAELRSALPRKKKAEPAQPHVRVGQLDKKSAELVAEFTKIAKKERCGENWLAFAKVLNRTTTALCRLEVECGVN